MIATLPTTLAIAKAGMSPIPNSLWQKIANGNLKNIQATAMTTAHSNIQDNNPFRIIIRSLISHFGHFIFYSPPFLLNLEVTNIH